MACDTADRKCRGYRDRSSASGERDSRSTCAIVHCRGALSGRQRWNDVP